MLKFTNINKVRGLEIGKKVFVQNSKGEFGIGRLVSETRDSEGTKKVFEVAAFNDEIASTHEPVLVSDIVAVRKIESDKPKTPTNGKSKKG